MSRVKLNLGMPLDYRPYMGQPNDLFRRFKRQFSILLNPDPTNRNFLESVYIKNDYLHTDLSNFCSYKEDAYRCIIGLTGIGKTTFIRNFFGFSVSNPDIPFCSNEIVFKNNEVFVMINPESTSAHESPQIHSGFIFGAVIDLLRDYYNIDIDDTVLFDFIKKNKPTLIQKATNQRNDNPSQILENMFKTNRRGLSLETLKFILCQDYCNIEKIIVILDNIEALNSWELKKKYVYESLIIYECLKNNLFNASAKLIISCRPDSYYHLLREDTFNGYPHRNELMFSEPTPIDEIFRSRFNALINRDGISNKNIEEWKIAYNKLLDVSKELSIGNNSMICSLCNYNTRESVNHFERILSNRRWFQDDMPMKPSFRINKNSFKTSEATKIKKSIIYGNGDKFIENEYSPIINFLKNYEDEDYDLIPLHIIAFFQTQLSKKESQNYLQYIDVSELLNIVEHLFIFKNSSGYFNKVINHLIDSSFLFVSPWDNGDKSLLALSPRANVLLLLMQESSLLLEAFHDDLWLDENVFKQKYSQELHEDNLYVELIKLVEHYINLEKECLSILEETGQLTKYTNYFGKRPITKILFKGLNNSTYAHFIKFASEKRIKKLKKLINSIEKTLTKV